MPSFIRILALASPLIFCFAQADTLSADQMMSRVSSGINKFVPDEGDSRNCILKYSINYKSLPAGSEGGPIISANEEKDLGARMTAALSIKDPKKSAAAMDAISAEMTKKIDNQKNQPSGKIVNQVTAVIEYKANGMKKTDIVLDMPAAANKDDIKNNEDLVLKKFEGRFCDHKTLGESTVDITPARPAKGSQ